MVLLEAFPVSTCAATRTMRSRTPFILNALLGVLVPLSELAAAPRGAKGGQHHHSLHEQSPSETDPQERTRRGNNEPLDQARAKLIALSTTLRNPFATKRLQNDPQDRSHPLTNTALTQLRLTAIIRDQAGTLKGSIETPSGRGFIVTVGSSIGMNRGVVSSITTAGLTVTEPADPTTDREQRTVQLSIRGAGEEWQIRHARERNTSSENLGEFPDVESARHH